MCLILLHFFLSPIKHINNFTLNTRWRMSLVLYLPHKVFFSFLPFLSAFCLSFDAWVVFILSIFCLAASEMENLGDDKKTRIESLKQKAINASNKFRNSLTRKGRRSSKVMSIEIEDVHDAEEVKVVDAFREVILSEELLPPAHDDYHMLLRFLYFSDQA